jgi:TrpR-related protein YerC/YecD
MGYNYKIQNDDIDNLFKGILKLDTVEECYKFFDDLCTINELEAFGQRIVVAEMLHNKVTYQEIENKTGISAATISKISKSYTYGPGGYKLFIEKLRD